MSAENIDSENSSSDKDTLQQIQSSLEKGELDAVLPRIINEYYKCGKELLLPDKSTPLHFTCQHGDIQASKLLIGTYSLKVDCKNDKGLTPLYISAKHGHLDLFIFLLRSITLNGPPISLHDPDQKLSCFLKSALLAKVTEDNLDDVGNTVLHAACSHGTSVDTIEYLVRMGFDPASTSKEGMPCLHLAAKQGHVHIVRYLLDHGLCDHSQVDSQGRSPAYIAAGSGHLDVLKYLVSKMGADSQFKTTKVLRNVALVQPPGRTLLHIASREGRTDVVKYLVLECYCDPSVRDNNGITAINLACYGGCLDIFKFLIQFDPTLVHITVSLESGKLSQSLKSVFQEHLKRNHSAYGRLSPIHAACSRSGCSAEVVKYLHEVIGLDPSSMDREGVTCLHAASGCGNFEVVKYLCEEANVDVSETDNSGRSPAYIAALVGHLDVLKYLIENQGANRHFKTEGATGLRSIIGRGLVHAACTFGHLNVIQYLVDSCGCDPTIKDTNGVTGLHLACQNGSLRVVKYLISKQCNVRDNTADGKSCLHAAVQEGSIELINYLKSLGLSINCTDKQNKSLLHFACARGNMELVKHLIVEQKLPINQKDSNGRSCLFFACTGKSIAVVRYLVEECKCDIFSKDVQGSLPIHLACTEGRTDIMEYLVSQGCDPNYRNDLGQTSIHAVASSLNLQAVELVVDKYGCDPDSEDCIGNTPLLIACMKSSADVIMYLANQTHGDPNHVSALGHSYLHCAIVTSAQNNDHSAIHIVKFLIEEFHCSPMPADENGMTPLHLALGLGDTETAYYLMKEHSCSPSTTDNKRRSCLTDATSSCDFDMIKYLIEEWHCNPSQKDNEGKSSLWLACSNRKLDVVQYLIENCLCSPECAEGYTSSLHAAAFSGSLEIVKLLVASQICQPDCRAGNGLTPLHVACKFGNADVVKYLLSLDCDPDSRYGNGRSCIHAAVFSENLEILKCFPDSNNFDSPDLDGVTPLHIACLQKRPEIVQYLLSQNCDPDRKLSAAIIEGKSQPKLDVGSISCLHLAVSNGDIDTVKTLISSAEIDVNCRDVNGVSPILIACRLDFAAIVYFLSNQESCDMDCKSNDGRTCFHAAAGSGNIEILKFLAEKKCNHTDEDYDGITPFHVACALGNKDIVSYFVKELGCDPHSQDESKFSFLDAAIHCGCFDVVKYLIEELKCNIKSNSKRGNPILYEACLGGYLEIVQYLISHHHCDPSSPNDKGWSSIVAAIISKNLDIVKYLIEDHKCDPMHLDHAGYTPFYASCEVGNKEIVQYLIEKCHCDPNWSSEKGRSCLHGAVVSGNVDLVKLLISDHNCDPNTEDSNGLNPLFLACAFKSKEMVKYITSLPQVDLTQRSSFKGYSCLHVAVAGGNIDIVQYLVEERNCHPNLSTDSGVTTLHLACEEGKVEVINYLLTFTACDPNATTTDGRTCLHAAIFSGNLHIIDFLVSVRNCDPHCKTNYGITPLHIACELGYINVVEYLINVCECDPNSKDGNSWTPHHYAASQDNVNIIKYLSKDHYDPNAKQVKPMSPFLRACYEERIEIEKAMAQGNHDLKSLGPSALSSLVSVLSLKKDNSNMNNTFRVGENSNDNSNEFVSQLNDLAKKNSSNCMGPKFDKENTNTSSDVSKKIKDDLECQEYSPLHLACYQGFIETVKYLVSSKLYDPNSVLSDGQSCLHCATSGGDITTIRYLVEEHNCDPSCIDSQGITPLMLACRKGLTEAVKFFQSQISSSHETNMTMFLLSLRCGHLDLVEHFISVLGWSSNERSLSMPLHIASSCGHLNIVKCLVENHQCDPLKEGINKDSPLHDAARNGRLDVIKYFIEIIGVYPSPEGENGNTPLHYTVNSGKLDAVNYLLIEAHCNLSCVNYALQTPLHLACAKGNLEMVRFLCRHIVFTDDPLLDREKNSPLHLAAANGHFQIVKYLIGADDPDASYRPQLFTDLDIKNHNRRSPAEEAKKHNYNDVHDCLIKASQSCKLSHTSVTSLTKVLALGDPGCGKFSLIKALSSVDRLLGWIVPVQYEKSSLSGSTQYDIEREEFGKINIFRFTGDSHYSIVHEYILHQFHCPLILLIVNIALPLKDIKRSMAYWKDLLYHSFSLNRKKVNVIVVASHADKDQAKANIDEVRSSLHQIFPFGRNLSGVSYYDYVLCNCRFSKSTEMKTLCQLIATVKKESCLPMSDPDHRLPLLGTSLLAYLRYLSKTQVCVTLLNLQKNILDLQEPDGKLTLLSRGKKLHEVCMYLKASGHLLYFEHGSDHLRNTVVLSDQGLVEFLYAILQDVQTALSNEMGILEETKVNEVFERNFPNFVPGKGLAIKCLFIFELSCMIHRDQLLANFESVPLCSSYYFFPELVRPSATRPSDSKLWNDEFSKLFTWCLQCKAERKFTSRFIRSLFCEVISDAGSQAQVIIWKNGILLDCDKTRFLVEMTDSNKKLSLVMQHCQQYQIWLVQKRSKLIALIKSLIHRICPNLDLQEYLVLSREACPLTFDIKLNSAEIASALLHNRHSITFTSGIQGKLDLSEVLIFDIFQEIDGSAIPAIIKSCSCMEAVPPVQLEKVCGALKRFPNTEGQLEEFKQTSTKQDFYQKIVKYSIFPDGNILVSHHSVL